MRVIRLIAACLVLGMLACEAHAEGPLLLVANKAEDTVSFIDVETGKTLGHATTGHHPHELAVTSDGKTAFVANYGAGDSLSVIDVSARAERRRLPLAPYRDPHGIQVSPDGRRVFVTCEESRAVVEIDVAGEKILRAVSTDQDVTHMLVVSHDGSRLYTANLRSGSATAIDLIKGTAVAQIKTGEGCEGIDVSPDGREVWTANKEADTVTVISTATNQATATLECPGRPIRLKFTPDGKRVLISCARTGDVAVLEASTRREIERIKTGGAPIGLVVEPSGRRAYVANTEANQVSIIDLAKLKIQGTLPTGREPDGMALMWNQK